MKLMLWFAPGVLFYEASSQHPGAAPLSLNCVLFSRPQAVDAGDVQLLATKVQQAHFKLDRLEESGELAHYSLANGPPDGYRWILVRPGRICVERIAGA